MKKFLVRCSCNKYVSWEVEASNELDALNIASNMNESVCVYMEEYNHEWTTSLIEDGIDEEKLQEEFCEKLNSLLHKRMTFDTLARTIREWSDIDNLELYEIDAEGDTDYQISFDITIDNHPLCGEYDIYYLKTRGVGEYDQEEMYITEVGYNL